jgi:hypothetical protein
MNLFNQNFMVSKWRECLRVYLEEGNENYENDCIFLSKFPPWLLQLTQRYFPTVSTECFSPFFDVSVLSLKPPSMSASSSFAQRSDFASDLFSVASGGVWTVCQIHFHWLHDILSLLPGLWLWLMVSGSVYLPCQSARDWPERLMVCLRGDHIYKWFCW